MASDALVGRDLGHYHVESIIGRGGMSVVYLATDQKLGRRIALKVLAPELADDEAFRTRFTRESQLAASLEHPNIVPVYEAGETDDLLFIAMRYIEGTDLKGLIRREHGLHPDRTIRLLRPVAAALDVAHRRGLIHRDVKPANILVSIDDRGTEHPYLSDFGLTKHAGSRSGLTQTGTFLGTVDYVAPEQIQGSDVDGRADQYSLACVLFEALTGDVPFDRDNDVARLFGHIQDAPPTATSRRPTLPSEIDEVLGHGMSKSPDQRYETCSELVEAAAKVLDTPAPTASAPTPTASAPTPTPTVMVPPPYVPPVPAQSSQPSAPPTPAAAQPSTPPMTAPAGPTKPGRSRTPILLGVVAIAAVVALVVGVLALTGGDERADTTGPTGSTQSPGPTGATGSTGVTSPVGGQPFSDDFSDPTSGWGTRTSPSVQTDYADGTYQISATEGTVLYQELKGHGVYSDASISVVAQPLSDKFAYYGVTCRGVTPTPSAGQTYYIQLTTDGGYAIGEYDFSKDPIFEDFKAGTSDAINPGQGSNVIEATCTDKGQGVEISLTVNGQFIDSAVDKEDPLPAGRVGLNIDTPKGSVISFDDFVVQPI